MRPTINQSILVSSYKKPCVENFHHSCLESKDIIVVVWYEKSLFNYATISAYEGTNFSVLEVLRVSLHDEQCDVDGQHFS